MPAGSLVTPVGSKHADDLGQLLLPGDGLDPSDGRGAAWLLLDPEVSCCKRCDLSQMRDANNLTGLAKGAQTLAHPASDLATHAGIDLVEDHGLDVAGRAQPRKSQHDPG